MVGHMYVVHTCIERIVHNIIIELVRVSGLGKKPNECSYWPYTQGGLTWTICFIYYMVCNLHQYVQVGSPVTLFEDGAKYIYILEMDIELYT